MHPIVLLLAVACGGGKNDEPLTVVTYNGGLAVGFVDGAEDRAPKVADAIAGLDADIVCMQEIWAPEHVTLIETTAKTAFPNTGFAEPEQDESTGTPACADGDIDALITCVADECGDSCQDELVDCVLAHCVGQLLALPKACLGCAMAEVGGTPEQIQATCETQSTSYAYDGSFGTGILSAHPMNSYEHTVFESTTNRRGAEHAVVESPIGDVDVYCTHLTAVFETIPYPRDTGSWAEEQLVQIDALHDWVDETAKTDTIILMGDFNAGPAIGDIDDEIPDAYAALAEGYDNFNDDGASGCTFCEENPLTGSSTSVLIDHILLKGFDGTGSPTRVFDQEITTISCDAEIPAALSDHYGLETTLTPG
jgi:endonuclease/exonuclease/phosphatase family metal-dependent hydrolase